MPIRAPDDANPGTGRIFMSRTATGEQRRVFAEVHIASTLIFHQTFLIFRLSRIPTVFFQEME